MMGTLTYVAPEIIKAAKDPNSNMNTAFSCEGDIWSLGVMIFAMLSCRHPFDDKNDLYT